MQIQKLNKANTSDTEASSVSEVLALLSCSSIGYTKNTRDDPKVLIDAL